MSMNDIFDSVITSYSIHYTKLYDPFDEQMPQGGAMYGAQPTYAPIDTGLDALLEKYGAKLGRDYVMDAECYVARQQGQPETPLRNNFV